MNQAKQIISSLSSNVQFYFSKHQALVAALADQKEATGKWWSQGLRVVTLIRKQMDAIQEEFSKADWNDFRALRDAMIEDENAEKKNIEKDSSVHAELGRLSGAVSGDHIKHESGRMKTICTSNVIAYFGIPASSYKYSDCNSDVKRILRKNGFSVRSRMSALCGKKKMTIGALRKKIADLGESGAFYVSVPGHAMLLDSMGRTIVDTAPRKRDRRAVVSVYKVTRNRSSSTFRF